MIEICIINNKNYRDENIYYQRRTEIRTLGWFFQYHNNKLDR
ncbi:hypothetical protein SPHINGO8BC_110126 [Sphingobacterium multivorum]|uniref:Uncharacterized protein n=1 Tax=Sphingobacterium multivorum TaxID=28454 RepID=A0A653YCJ6_SPHMU|nr:hypothetical protein SPHINGO8BC_110126 [Sphingobacterium multivorum]